MNTNPYPLYTQPWFAIEFLTDDETPSYRRVGDVGWSASGYGMMETKETMCHAILCYVRKRVTDHIPEGAGTELLLRILSAEFVKGVYDMCCWYEARRSDNEARSICASCGVDIEEEGGKGNGEQPPERRSETAPTTQ